MVCNGQPKRSPTLTEIGPARSLVILTGIANVTNNCYVVESCCACLFIQKWHLLLTNSKPSQSLQHVLYPDPTLFQGNRVWWPLSGFLHGISSLDFSLMLASEIVLRHKMGYSHSKIKFADLWEGGVWGCNYTGREYCTYFLHTSDKIMNQDLFFIYSLIGQICNLACSI